MKKIIKGIEIDVRSENSCYVTIGNLTFYLEHDYCAPMFVNCWEKGCTEDSVINLVPEHGYKPLSKFHSNLGMDGVIKLYCPHCFHSWLAGHLCWSAFMCTNCKEYVDKTDYLIKENK